MKTNLDVLYKPNTTNEVEGVWFETVAGAKFKVKRFGGMNTPELKKQLAKHYKPYAKLIERGLMPEDKERKIYTKVFVETALLDWQGIIVDDKEVPFSKEAAIDLLCHLPELGEIAINLNVLEKRLTGQILSAREQTHLRVESQLGDLFQRLNGLGYWVNSLTCDRLVSPPAQLSTAVDDKDAGLKIPFSQINVRV